MRVRLALAALVLASCVQAELLPCGELACPIGSVCVEDRVCAAPDQLAACSGLADGTGCQASAGTGRCVAGVCVANVCGDGVRTGAEVCDGSDLGVGCVDLGFYEGTPVCTAGCTVETTGCTGRCGDGEIQASAGEQCDGAAPTEGCVSFGRDYGRLTCNQFCAPAITDDCRYYGWTTRLSGAAGPLATGQANARGAIALSQTQAIAVWDGVQEVRPLAGYSAVAASSTMLVAVGPARVLTHTGMLREIDVATPAPSRAFASEAGIVYTLSGCALTRIDPVAATATTLASPPATACTDLVALADDAIFVAAGAAGLQWWNGTAWTALTAEPARYVQLGEPGKLVVFGNFASRYEIDLGTTPPTATAVGSHGPFDFIAADVDGNLYDVEIDDDESDAWFGLMLNWTDAVTSQFLARSAHGRILRGDGGRLLEMTPTALTRPLQIGVVRSLHLAADGLLMCGDGVERMTPTSSGQLTGFNALANGECRAASGSAEGEHFVAAFTGIYRSTGTFSYTREVASPFEAVAGDATEAYAWGTTLQRRSGGMWTQISAPTGCDFKSISGHAGGAFHAVARCGQRVDVFALSPSGATVVATLSGGGAAKLRTAADGAVFVVHLDRVYRLDGTNLVEVDLGSDVYPVSAADFFVSAGNGLYRHHAGGSIFEVRAPVGPFAVTPTHLYVVSGGQLHGIARMPSIPNTGL